MSRDISGTVKGAVLHLLMLLAGGGLGWGLVEAPWERPLSRPVPPVPDRRAAETGACPGCQQPGPDERPGGLDPVAPGEQLKQAIERGDHQRVERLLDRGVSPDTVVSGRLGLARTAGKASLGVAELLLRYGASRSEILAGAVLAKKLENVLLALRSGASASWRDPKQELFLLHEAIGHPLLVAALLRAGAHPEVVDENGVTPLGLAIQGDDVASVLLLLEAGAKLESVERGSIVEALERADDLALLLLAHGVSPFEERGAKSRLLEEEELEPLYVEFLLHAPPGHRLQGQVLGRLLDRLSALDEGMAMTLLDHGLGVQRAGALLWWAVECQHEALALALVRRGADIRRKDERGSTLLHEVSSEMLILELVRRGADPRAKDGDGETALEVNDLLREMLARGLLRRK